MTNTVRRAIVEALSEESGCSMQNIEKEIDNWIHREVADSNDVYLLRQSVEELQKQVKQLAEMQGSGCHCEHCANWVCTE